MQILALYKYISFRYDILIFPYIKINDFHLWENYSNRKCGKLMCKHTTETILEIQNATIIYANVSGSICVSLEYKPDHLDVAKMWVPNGAVCGNNKVSWPIVFSYQIIF